MYFLFFYSRFMEHFSGKSALTQFRDKLHFTLQKGFGQTKNKNSQIAKLSHLPSNDDFSLRYIFNVMKIRNWLDFQFAQSEGSVMSIIDGSPWLWRWKWSYYEGRRFEWRFEEGNWKTEETKSEFIFSACSKYAVVTYFY